MTEHIKMPDVVPVIRYFANGAETAFPYPIPIFASEDMAVYKNGAITVSGFDITGEVMAALGSLNAIWGVGLSVLGIYVWKRSDEKKVLSSGETIYWR